ncbi:PREDICTED: glycerophosphodiester phosphodiesterase GDPD5-like isoform X2 [Camelina sativa]|uniref:glycerophosphodiester phosphodiesterase n=1 Tax=Camelina sativa TaxID=90675 RepID=A0ABM0SUC3_CAMSA|nr:PREDICTED: glycerophosphodiester phosphodiesterase GDPD5-like isoform X2 [Camelina sativa]
MILLVIWLSLLTLCAGRPLYSLPGKEPHTVKLPLQTSRPYNIAHRGSNGEIPEETAASYLRAIEEGTDFIETDILSSKDGVLICFHDVILDETTNVATHKEFADREKTYEVQGFNVTGFFPFDFTLKELIRTKQRYAFRDQQYNDSPKVLLIDDITMPTQDTNQTYAEITSDAYFNYIKQYVVGIGPWKDTIVPVNNNYMLAPTDLVKRAHAHNLQVM